ncbi:hypothetical protein [Chromobacterium sphagni]|uniref:hypothetical protein n=1 Tax=Chromobacterium sphagni TaxID=1903179 RepID=UPI001EFBB3C1|nr:hypothetical protein [Chromobacterium sphagni]
MAGERIRYANSFDDPDLSGSMTATVMLTPASCGAELGIVQEGIPDAIPAE